MAALRYGQWFNPYNVAVPSPTMAQSAVFFPLFPSFFSLEVVDCSRIPEESSARRLYDSPLLLDFVRLLFKNRELRRYNDLGAALNFSYMEKGDSVGWHFNTCDVVVAVVLQLNSIGGRLRFSANNRSGLASNSDHIYDVATRPEAMTHEIPYRERSVVFFRGATRCTASRMLRDARTGSFFLLLSYDTSNVSHTTESLDRVRYAASKHRAQ